MRQTATITERKGSFDLTNGREELNLAEFPLIYHGQRVPKGLTKLVFEKESVDQARNRTFTKRLEIHATEEHGLAKGADMMVLHALMLIAKETTNLSSPVVHFSRYQLCEIVGWPQSGNSYKRIQEALERWVSVTLFYKAWYDREEERLQNLKGFHILEDIELNDYDIGRVGRTKQGELPLSTIRFGDRVFKSLKAGNVKKLNLAELFHLKLSLSQRLYSFLDKRFGTRQLHWEFNLRELCTVHLGMSTNYKPSELKRKLQPAIAELVSIGFITDVPNADRFQKISHGVYRVSFRRASRDKIVDKPLVGPKKLRVANRQLIKRLTDFGVSANVAQRFIEDPEITEERIEQKIELLKWYQDTTSSDAPKRPGGWLAKAIQEDWSPPKGFMTKAEREEKASRVKAKKEEKARKQREAKAAEDNRIAQEKQQEAEKWTRVSEFLGSITELEREALISAAIAAESEINRKYMRRYRANPQAEGINEIIFQQGLVRHILPILNNEEAA